MLALPLSPPPPHDSGKYWVGKYVSTPAHWVAMDTSFPTDVHLPVPPTLEHQLPSSPIVMSLILVYKSYGHSQELSGYLFWFISQGSLLSREPENPLETHC